MARLRALVFDFDGLICDTETSEYETVREVYESFGVDLPLAVWQRRIGTYSRHWLDELEDVVGPISDRDRLLEDRVIAHHARVYAEPALPGVVELMEAAATADVGIAVASSASSDWVDEHLGRLGLADLVGCVSCRAEGVPAKPAPDVYLAALGRLGVTAAGAVALEDSPNGLAAAHAAGIRCVAVPNPLTADLDLSSADLVVASLAYVTLPDLESLLTPNSG